MFLHEAIVKILREKNCDLKTQEIADEVNRRSLYAKKDGTDITAFQIHRRTRNYSNLFTRKGSSVGLVELGSEPTKNTPQIIKKPSTKLRSPEVFLTQKNVTTTTYLKKAGFIKIGSIQNLFSCGLPSLPELNNCGLYAISISKSYKVSFIAPETAKAKNIIRPWSIENLRDKWVEKVDIIYYGIAGSRSFRSLRNRLRDLIRHGLGKISRSGPHKGGEIMWQLQGYGEFSIWIIPTGGPPEPKDCEHGLLKTFYENTGKLPFANRQF